MIMKEKTFYFFRFLGSLSFLFFMYYIRSQAAWALYVGLLFVASYVIYIEIALPKDVFKGDKEETS